MKYVYSLALLCLFSSTVHAAQGSSFTSCTPEKFSTELAAYLQDASLFADYSQLYTSGYMHRPGRPPAPAVAQLVDAKGERWILTFEVDEVACSVLEGSLSVFGLGNEVPNPSK